MTTAVIVFIKLIFAQQHFVSNSYTKFHKNPTDLVTNTRPQSRIPLAIATFNRKKILLTSKLDLNLRKKLVKCYIWSIVLYGA
jgi:hypothetical protein